MKMEAEGACSNLFGEVRGSGRGFYEDVQVAPTTSVGQQGPSSPAEYGEHSSSHGYSMGLNYAPPSPVRPVLEQGALDSSTPSGHQTDKMLYSSPAVSIPNIVLTPALSFRSQALNALRGEQFRPNMIHSWNPPPSPPNLDSTTSNLESFNNDQHSRIPNDGLIMREDCSSCFMPDTREVAFAPTGPFAADMNPRSNSSATSVPFSQYHQTGHLQNVNRLTDFTQREEQQRIHSTAAIGLGGLTSNLTDTPPPCVPQRGPQESIHPNPSSDQFHVVPKLYNPSRILTPEAGLTELEVRHHYLPFHNLPSLVPRKFGDGGPMVGPARDCFRSLKPDRSFSPSSASSDETITESNAPYLSTTLADLVRESEPMLPNPKANEKDAEYITPSAATYLNPTAVHTPSSTLNDLWYFPGDRDFLWTYSRSPPTETELQAHSDDDATIFHHREIMATYTSAGGWRTMPRGSYAGSRFGAVGERLVPLTMQEVGEAGRESANEDIETGAPR